MAVTFDRKQYDWSEQARVQEVDTLSSSVNSHIGASNVGLNASRKKDDARLDAHIDAANVPMPRGQKPIKDQPRSVKLEDDTHSSATSYTEPSPASEEDDTRYVAYGAYSGAQLRNRKSSVMKDDIHRKSSVMEDDTQFTLRNHKKKEDRSLETEESQTIGNMQVETDTGQTVYTQVEPETGQTAYIQVEPDTGQTAYTLPSMTTPLPEEDRRVALLSVDRAVARQTAEEPPVFNDRLVLSPIETSFSMLQLEDTVDKLLLIPRYHDYRVKPETEKESLEGPDSVSDTSPRYRERPLAKLNMEIQGETRPLYEENLVHNDTRDNDVPTQDCKGKAEVDAKAGATRHLPTGFDDVTERAIYAPDAKADKHRHSTPNTDELTYRNDLNRMLNCRRIRTQDKWPEIKVFKQKSTYTKRQNKQR